jgi:outer membrane protein OmpA-like peptidoglycan-associated protein
MRVRVVVVAALAVLGSPGLALAEDLRLHGSVGAARAVGGHQKDELGWGGDFRGALELPLTHEFGLMVEAGVTVLTEATAPSDARIVPEGAAAGFGGGFGIRLRPFASAYSGPAISSAGFWASAATGLETTNGLSRTMFNFGTGFDFLLDRAQLGIGPSVGYLQILQPDDEIRPSDANILTLGVHAVWDFSGGLAKPLGDKDRDGIYDHKDKCPDDPEDKDGWQDEDGCPELDNDKDGVADTVDRCPLVPEDKDGFFDNDGCPEDDNDQDGIKDPKDKCPNEAEDPDGFEDEDGCPEKDNDKDGILDREDLCPNEPETVNNYADHDGCPDADQIRVVGDKIVLDDRVHFQLNSAVIRQLSFPLLERLAQLLVEHPEYIHISVEGHTDKAGPDDFNQKLSEDRAASVAAFLASHGVARERLSSKGFANTRPLVPEISEFARLTNRRVEFVVTREQKELPPSAAPAPDAAPPSPDAAPPAGVPPSSEAPPPSAPPSEDPATPPKPAEGSP